MSDNYHFETMAEGVLYNYTELTRAKLKRRILLALKEVERDTRHKAADIAADVQSQIINMTHGRI